MQGSSLAMLQQHQQQDPSHHLMEQHAGVGIMQQVGLDVCVCVFECLLSATMYVCRGQRYFSNTGILISFNFEAHYTYSFYFRVILYLKH